MKANELRIGNLLKDSLGEIIEVTDISKDGINHNYGCVTIGIEELNGIELSEELLTQLGFAKMTDTTPYNYRIYKSKTFFYIRYGTFTTDKGLTNLIGFNGLFVGNKFVRVIKYVHEVQNLVFALTGEELKLKEDENN
jgi:hypothetical protein